MAKDMDSKALEKAAQDYELYHDVDDSQPYLYTVRGDIAEAFKAGAKWMSEQGQTWICEIDRGRAVLDGVRLPFVLWDTYEDGDRVNVQITKID